MWKSSILTFCFKGSFKYFAVSFVTMFWFLLIFYYFLQGFWKDSEIVLPLQPLSSPDFLPPCHFLSVSSSIHGNLPYNAHDYQLWSKNAFKGGKHSLLKIIIYTFSDKKCGYVVVEQVFSPPPQFLTIVICIAGSWTQGFKHSRQMIYHWAITPVLISGATMFIVSAFGK